MYAWQRMDLDPNQIIAHWMQESELDWRSVGYNPGSTDHGLGQINSRSYPWIKQMAIDFCKKKKLTYMLDVVQNRNVYDIEKNAFLSIIYIKYQQDRYGKGTNAIVAYNAGSAQPLYGCFKAYHDMVRKYMHVLKS
jgi:hypothetical protein